MGGRGASIKGFISDGKGGTKVGTFYDLTKKYKGMDLHTFENKIRDRKSEYIGIADKNGKIVIAGTSHKKGSVVVPSSHPNFKQLHTLTHNHPYHGDRGIGGSFSAADVYNHAKFKIPGETRAVSRGKSEFNYILRTTKQSNAKKLLNYAKKVENNKLGVKFGKEALEKANKSGKTFSIKEYNSIYLGGMKRRWKNNKEFEKTGYLYIEKKRE